MASKQAGGFLAHVAGHVLDPAVQWDLGTFGAIAEFMREPDEPAQITRADGSLAVATTRGALRVEDRTDVRIIAYETVSRHAGQWRHGIALCIPRDASAMHGRRVVTELGRDRAAVRAEDRPALLFDLGLGLLQADVCVRTADPGLIAALRAGEGRDLFEAGNPVSGEILRAGPHRVFMARLGRIEVFQPIPPPTGKSPAGPHTHILPKLLRSGRTHAATEPIPDGLVPAAHIYPPHPMLDDLGLRKPFDRAHFDAFAALYRRYAGAEQLCLQEQVAGAVREGLPPAGFAVPDDRFARGCVRVTLRKLKAAGEGSAALDSWLTHYDRATAADGDDAEAVHAC
jgi:hypothetical protein